MVTSFLLLAGLGVLVVATAGVSWIMVNAMAPDVLPAFGTFLAVAVGAVIVEVVLGTGLMTLGAFLYNLSALYSGGVEIAVTEALSGPAPAAARTLPRTARVRRRPGASGSGDARFPQDRPDTGQPRTGGEGLDAPEGVSDTT
ncbi:hypothetical protein ACH4JS_28765 [Streptomyces sp. NPDC017638]|uniref:hypothetical protein n=1 Tax=Streptomyces sp. NPDC017638 TaxID=3365004 RepID=UPI00379D9099